MPLGRWFAKLLEPKPFNEGFLPEQDGHRVYFAEFGNPKGEPILTTHGGPGSSINPRKFRMFGMGKFRWIMFDQRGCGRSEPKGRLEHNTTQKTLGDMARLLDYLGVKGKVVVRGGSWASTLALLFAEAYPERVSKLVVSQIFLCDKVIQKWMLEDSGLFYPDVLEKVRASNKSGKSFGQDCLEKVLSGDASMVRDAMSNYGGYEHNLGSLEPVFEVAEADEKDLGYARIFMHYDARDFFVEPEQIMKNIGKISHIPTLIVHNRLDMICPVEAAWRLHKAMPGSKLVIVPDRGHGSKKLYEAIEAESRRFLNG